MPLTFSIVITCYNKEAFIAQAVESAIRQSYRHKEVVVVDDGSKDGSLAVIRRFSDSVTVVAKPNGGHVSAANAGFARSSGDVVIFLDADDFLFEDTLERIQKAWSDRTSKVHFPLQVVDGEGRPVEGRMLPPYKALPEGDMMENLRRFGFYPTPPTSGNAFCRAFLADVMPLDEAYPVGFVDTTLIGMSALYGVIGTLDSAGGCWRKSGGNMSAGGLRQLVQKLRTDRKYIALLNENARARVLGHQVAARWPQHLKDRFILERLGVNAAGDGTTLFTLFRQYCRTLLTWPEYHLRDRVRFLAWSVVICLLPVFLIRRVPGILGPNVDLSCPE